MADEEKVHLIENVWKAPPEFKFPIQATKTLISGVKGCKLAWLEKYDWLVYSPSVDALFCMPCVLFKRYSGGNAALTTDGLDIGCQQVLS